MQRCVCYDVVTTKENTKTQNTKTHNQVITKNKKEKKAMTEKTRLEERFETIGIALGAIITSLMVLAPICMWP